ncbi:MAG: GNAT family protein [Candidatus Limnocylindrales bacterium]
MEPLPGERITLRPLGDDDRAEIRRILEDPTVARWWGPGDVGTRLEEWFADDGTVRFAVELAGRVVGTVQFHEENEPDYRHAGLDIFLDREHQGQGLGSDALRTLARYLIDVRGHHRLTIDPSAANERAIRAYTKVGFRPVGVMRDYERGPDGSFHDGLLMDLLAGELT